MKKNLIMTSAILFAMLLVGCNNVKDDAPEPEQGEPTQVKIRVTDVRPQTKAPKDQYATENEIKLYKADVFIFSEAGSFEKHTPLLDTDFEYEENSDDVYVSKVTINTTTGNKQLYIGINLPASMVDIIKTSPSSVSTHSNPSELYNPGGTGMSMFNEKIYYAKFDKNPDLNDFEVKVDRMAVKITFQEGNNLDYTREASSATYSDIRFAMGNLNTKIFPLQDTGKKDPNYNGDITPGNPDIIDYEDDFINEYDDVNAYTAITEKGKTNITDFVAKYALENTSLKHLMGESTFASVRATFRPLELASYTSGTITQTPLTDPTPVSLYVLKTPNNVFYYFTDEDEANDANNALFEGKGLVRNYLNGFCYYWIFLDSTNGSTGNGIPYDVLRNEYYRYTVEEIGMLGHPNPGPGPDEKPKPIEDPTEITVNAQLLPWVTYNQGLILQ